MPLCIYFIRHGQTEWSIAGRHTGRTDIPLTAHGEDQARELKRRLGHTSFTLVLTSPRQRAIATCRLAGLGAPSLICHELEEWDYGNYEGLDSEEIRKTRPGWNIFQYGCPGGETPAQVSIRADRLIEHLRAIDGNVALFSHGQFGGVFVSRWIEMPALEGMHFPLAEASVSVLTHDLHHPRIPVVAHWNSTAYNLPPAEGLANGKEILGISRTAIERWENEGGEIPAPLQAPGYLQRRNTAATHRFGNKSSPETAEASL